MSFIYSCFNEPADWLYARMGAQTKPWYVGLAPSPVPHELTPFLLLCSPEQYATLFSLISFWWLNPLMLLGHKKSLTDDG